MKRIAILCWLGLLALLCVPQLAHAEAYRCKKADGSLAFQDQPCPPGASGSQTDLPAVQGYAPSSSDRSVRTAASSSSPDPNAAARAQVQAVNRSNRCNHARQELGVMQEQRPVYHYDNNGNKVFVADQERPAAIATARETIAADCE
jgi:hypothetical protein